MTTSGVRSALTPNTVTCEIADSWTTHGDEPEQDQAQRELGLVPELAHGTCARSVPGCAAVRIWTTSKWRRSADGVTWT